MAFFSIAIKVLIFGIYAGVVLAALVFIPATIYVIPYWFWTIDQNSKGRHKDKKKEKLSRSIRNATRLYAAWITRREPTF